MSRTNRFARPFRISRCRCARRTVTLTVELGRVNLTVTQLAELKPGDVVELGGHLRTRSS